MARDPKPETAKAPEKKTDGSEKPDRRTASVPPKPIIKFDNFVKRHTGSVDVETLSQKGLTRINYLTLSKVNELISIAVWKAFQKYQREGNEAEAREIQAQVRSEVAGEITRARAKPPAAAAPSSAAGNALPEGAADDDASTPSKEGEFLELARQGLGG